MVLGSFIISFIHSLVSMHVLEKERGGGGGWGCQFSCFYILYVRMSCLHLYGCILNGYFKCIGFIEYRYLMEIQKTYEKVVSLGAFRVKFGCKPPVSLGS